MTSVHTTGLVVQMLDNRELGAMLRGGKSVASSFVLGAVLSIGFSAPAEAAQTCDGGTSTNKTFFLTSGASTTNQNDAWRFKVEITSVTGSGYLATKNKYATGNGYETVFYDGPVGRWDTGNFSQIQTTETVTSQGGNKNFLYSRSCTRI